MKFRTEPGNAPMSRPGVYVPRNMINQKCYVGIGINLKKRIGHHSCGDGRSPAITAAIKKYGTEAFEVIPLYYALDIDEDALLEAEAQMIADWNSVLHGYNIMESSRVGGPRGKRHSDAVRAAFKRPEVKKKIRDYWNSDEGKAHRQRMVEFKSTPESRAINSAAQALRFSTPESRASLSATATERMKDPALRAQISSTSLATKSDPKWVAKQRTIMKEVNNRPETKERMSAARKKAMADPAAREKIAAAKRGGVWITDGRASRYVRPNTPMPLGWARGRHKRLIAQPR